MSTQPTCAGTTQAGNPCKLKPRDNGYCAKHQEQALLADAADAADAKRRDDDPDPHRVEAVDFLLSGMRGNIKYKKPAGGTKTVTLPAPPEFRLECLRELGKLKGWYREDQQNTASAPPVVFYTPDDGRS